jgi:hypothetical protein
VTLFAGGIAGYSDGQRTIARFQSLSGLGSDLFGNLIVCDGHMIRQIRPDGMVVTKHGYTDGNGLANLSNPRGLAVGSNGQTWIADTGNHRIRRIIPDDWERDGIPDGEEGGTTPFVVGVNDREVDSDGDGQTNWLEYRGGSNPLNASSQFQIKVDSSPQSTHVQIQWFGKAQRAYQLEYTEDLTTWLPISSTGAPYWVGFGGLISASHEKGQAKQRFYRVTPL